MEKLEKAKATAVLKQDAVPRAGACSSFPVPVQSTPPCTLTNRIRPAELDVLVLEAELKLDDAAAAKDFAACKDLTSHLEALKDRRKLSPTVGELNVDITACQESING